MISDELKRIYASNPRELRAVDTIELSHSLFSQTFYFVRDDENHTFLLESGFMQEFMSYGFEINLPDKGSNQQDLAFVLDNVARLGTEELARAIQKIDEPIKLVYRPFIIGDIEMQSDPLVLSLTNIVLTAKSVTARATRTDLINRKFPFGKRIYFDYRFGGII